MGNIINYNAFVVHCVALKLIKKKSTYLSFPSSAMKGMCHQARQIYFYLCTSCLSAYQNIHYVWGGIHGGQKWVSELLELELIGSCEPTCRSWELNLGPVGQPMLLTIESSLQLLKY